MASNVTANWSDAKTRAVCEGINPIVGAAFKIHLVTDDVVPDYDTDTLGDLVEIVGGNGYPADGYDVTQTESASGFPVIAERAVENDVRAQIKDVLVQASGGTIPPSGSKIQYAVVTDANPTKNLRKVFSYHDSGVVGGVEVTNGNTLTIEQNTPGQWDLGDAES